MLPALSSYLWSLFPLSSRLIVLVVVAVVIVVEITPPPCQECIRPQVGCSIKTMRLSLSLPLVSLTLSLCHRRQNHPLSLWSLLPSSSSLLKSPPLPARNASGHRLVVVSKNEVVIVLAFVVFVVVLVSRRCCCLCGCFCHRHHRRNHPPSLTGMHLTAGWLLCQK